MQATTESPTAFPFASIRHLLVDLDGVLYRGSTPLPNAAEFVDWLRRRKVDFRLVTNNATLTQSSYRAKLAAMGIEVSEDEVFTSSLATALYLEQQSARGQAAFVIGEEGIRSALENIGMRLTDDRPQWVVAGLDRTLTYDKLATAALALAAGARFVGTNPDTSFPSERGLLPGAGSILALLQATTGIAPTVIGKPQPLMLELAMENMGGSTADTAMLGDRLDTDILGAVRLDLPSILVLTGVSKQEEIATSGIHPWLVIDDLGALMRCWE